MRGVPHHLLDVCEPGDFFSMTDFQAAGLSGDRRAFSRAESVPFLVGGTGLYVASRDGGLPCPTSEPEPLAYREELEKLDTPELYRMLLENAAPRSSRSTATTATA